MAAIKRFRWIDVEAQSNRPVLAWLIYLLHPNAWRPRRYKLNLTISGKTWQTVTVWCMPRLRVRRMNDGA